MNRSLFTLLFLLSAGICLSQKKVSQTNGHVAVRDLLGNSTVLKMEGHIGHQCDLAYENRILAQNQEKLVAPFRNRTEASCWQSEFWGKWFTSAVLAYRYHPTPGLKLKLDSAVAGLISTQTPDGYIGNYADDKHLQSWDIWGRKYCMLGLLAWYDVTKEKKCLQATRLLADHLIKELTDRKEKIVLQGNHRGMAASSVLEPICLLYNFTNEQRYLDFALEIVRQWETPEGPQLISKANVNVGERFLPKPSPQTWYSKNQGQKAYEMMSCYEGLLELYRITGTPEYLKAVEATWQNILDTEINIVGSGASTETWFGGKKLQTRPIAHYQETCVTATWIKLSHQLFRLTGAVKYADAIENAYYNALLGSMTADGSDWSKYTPVNGERMHGSEQCGMGLNCCTASGPRALFLLPNTIVMGELSGVRVNYFVPGSYALNSPRKQPIEISQSGDYPVSGKTILRLKISKPEQFELKIRIPEWSLKNSVKVDGLEVPNVQRGEYLTVNRLWKDSDEVTLELDMRTKIQKLDDPNDFLALIRGPLVLARDARLGGASVDESIAPITNKEGYLDLQVAPANSDYWITGKALFQLESYTEKGADPVYLNLCDYSSAGSTYTPESRFRIWFQQRYDPRKN
jgi:DUF1680 family protein